MSTPSARLRRDRTTDTVSGRRVRAVVMAQAASAIFGDARDACDQPERDATSCQY